MHPLVIMNVSTREQPIEIAGGTACEVDVDGSPASPLLREVLSEGLASLYTRNVHRVTSGNNHSFHRVSDFVDNGWMVAITKATAPVGG